MQGIHRRPIVVGACGLMLLIGLQARAEDPTPRRAAAIALASGSVNTESSAAVPIDLAASAGAPDAEDYLLVKFPGPVTADQRDRLQHRVERIYTYLPHDAFLVKMTAARRHELSGAELGATWTGSYHPAYKISPTVAAIDAADDAAGTDDGRRIVLLHVFPDAPLDDVIGEIKLLGRGEIVAARQRDRFSRIRLLMSRQEIVATRADLARLSAVFYLDLEARRVLLNDTTVWVAQSGTAGGQQTPIHDHGITGGGQIIGVLDTGIDADMCYFADGTLGLPPINPCDGGTVVDHAQRKVIAVDFLAAGECAGGVAANEWDTQDHGSHVAGIAAGDNFANPITHDPGDGMAPAAKLVIQDGGFAGDNCADLPGIGCPVVDLNPIFQQAYDQGARIHNNSWGDDENNPNGGLYSAGSEDADEFMWNHPDFLLLFAAGNNPGATNVLSPGTAKNVVAVGATLRGDAAESMAGFSSCGPTADGRIKPDITLPGANIVSANADNNTGSGNCDTRPLSGTSMASPAAAGAAALVRQYYMDGWYPTGSADPADAFTPSAALIKATLINSGHNMTGTLPIPAQCQGWGRILLDDALQLPGDARKLFTREDAGFARGVDGGDRVFHLSFDAGEPLEVTLAWTDFPSTPAAGSHLVNDLDLTVTGPGGTYLGNVFFGGESNTGGSADRLNSVEQVLLTDPPAGDYTITVSAFNVPEGPQPFALVVTGACVPDACGICGGDASSCAIFTDGFESGDLTAWTSAVP